jgi:uncharacterized NAD(P)/FAD-binding protein YdhS
MERIGIIGGGFSGASAAVHLARLSPVPLAIDIIEPRSDVGAGLAYGSCGAEHRLNVPADRMIVVRDGVPSFATWLKATGEDVKDPDGATADGSHYPRRAVFGRYMRDLVRDAQAKNRSGSSIRHLRRSADSIEKIDDGWSVRFGGDTEVYRHLVLAVTHACPAIPWPKVSAANIIDDPWEPDALSGIPENARIVIVGSGLTMCDVVVTLRKQGHRGQINVISRRGLTPRPQNGFTNTGKLGWQDNPPATASQLLRDLRRKVRATEAEGGVWQSVLNAVREQAREFWTKLPLKERARIVRHLRPYWDVHRFRAAPQISALMDKGRSEGWLRNGAGRIHTLQSSDGGVQLEWTPRGGERSTLTADFAINCTGPDANIARSGHEILRTALADGIIRRDALGLGIDIDERNRAFERDGTVQPGLWIAGPMGRAFMGDCTGLPEVADQTRAVAEGLAASLAGPH